MSKIKQGNTNIISNDTWRSLLFELLLNKKILLKLLKEYDISEDCNIQIFKKDYTLTRKYSTFFDLLIKLDEKEIFVIIGNFRFVEDCDNAIAISVYRKKEHISIEELVYSSTNKKAKIIFSYLRNCDTRQIYTNYTTDEDLLKLSFYILNNLELPINKFLDILYKRLNNNKNKITREILINLLLVEKVNIEVVCNNLNINRKYFKDSLDRLLKRFSYLKKFLIIEEDFIGIRE